MDNINKELILHFEAIARIFNIKGATIEFEIKDYKVIKAKKKEEVIYIRQKPTET